MSKISFSLVLASNVTHNSTIAKPYLNRPSLMTYLTYSHYYYIYYDYYHYCDYHECFYPPHIFLGF